MEEKEIVDVNQELEKSTLFQLKNGRYFADEEQSRIFSELIRINPFENNSYSWDEMSMGDLYADIFRESTLYCPEAKSWYIYNGKRWIRDVDGIESMNRLKLLARLLDLYCVEINDRDPERLAKYRKFINKLSDRRSRDRVLKDAQGEMKVGISEFDSDPYLVNCQNGIYDLRKGKLLQHDPKKYLTMITNCKCPTAATALTFTRWAQFIDEVTCGDKQVSEYLQTALGYCLLGSSKEECMFILHGKTTRNGKSTLIDTIGQILGDYAKAMPVDFICQSKHSSSDYSKANPLLAGLRGKRFVNMSESDSAGRLDEAVIKNYTGGDPITTRNLHEKDFTFIPQFKMWLLCNSLPAVQDRSLFSSNRIKIIEFNAHFDKTTRDVNLKSLFLTDEAKMTIFKWMADGYKLYVKKGLRDLKTMEEAVTAYEKSNDLIGMFVEEKCELGEDCKCGRGEFYNAYKTWCNSNGLKPISSPRFFEQIGKYARATFVQGVAIWKGIRIKPFTVKLEGDDGKNKG